MFEILAARAADRRMDVVEKKTILDILKLKRFTDAWRSVLPEKPASRVNLADEEEREFTMLALDFYRFRVLSQSISAWRSWFKNQKLKPAEQKAGESANLGTPRSSTGSSLQKNMFKHY